MGASSPMCDLLVVRCSNIFCALRHSWRGGRGGEGKKGTAQRFRLCQTVPCRGSQFQRRPQRQSSQNAGVQTSFPEALGMTAVRCRGGHLDDFGASPGGLTTMAVDLLFTSGGFGTVAPPWARVRYTPRVTFCRVVVSLRGPGQSPVLPFACCVGSLRSVGRCGRCSRWCCFRVRGAQWLVCRGCAAPPSPNPPKAPRMDMAVALGGGDWKAKALPLHYFCPPGRSGAGDGVPVVSVEDVGGALRGVEEAVAAGLLVAAPGAARCRDRTLQSVGVCAATRVNPKKNGGVRQSLGGFWRRGRPVTCSA